MTRAMNSMNNVNNANSDRTTPGISRRTVLRGLGTAVALPWLESLAPAPIRWASRAAASPLGEAAPLRMAYVFIPNGVDPAAWMAESGSGPLPASLSPLEPLRSKFSVLRGLAHRNAQALGDGPGDHARSAACFLTGSHPVKTAGTDISVGVSIDQEVARTLGARSPIASLEIGCEPALQSGNCDSGYSCAYSANISWRTPRQPNLKEIRPREVFERLFAIGPARESEEARSTRLASRRSILDFVREDAQRIQATVSGTDRHRIDEYFDGVRALERRLAMVEEAKAGAVPSMSAPTAGVPEDYREHVRLMNEMIALAFRLDRTRVITFMLANEGSNRSFPFLGVPEGHHHLSHHGGDQAMVEKIRQINRFQCEMFAHLLAQLEAAKEGEKSVLDSSLIVFGSAITDGNKHDHDDLPILLAGGGGGRVSPGRHLRFKSGTPLCNLYASMLQMAGTPAAAGQTPRFGDSTGVLTDL